MHFKRLGWIYVPLSICGWIVTIVYLGVSIYTLIIIGQNYDSLRSSLIRFFPYFISFSVVFFWIAGNSSKDDK
jgi:hypothetical protein